MAWRLWVNRDLLVLDEPINGLDPQGIAEVRDTISFLQEERNMTVLISSTFWKNCPRSPRITGSSMRVRCFRR